MRQELARAWSKVKIMQINGYRTLTDALERHTPHAALGATNKMFWSEYHRDTMALAIDILGMEGQVLSSTPGAAAGVAGLRPRRPLARRGKPGYRVSELQASYFFSRSETIWGGTAEIQRNIVGERVLGLPKEPKATATCPAPPVAHADAQLRTGLGRRTAGSAAALHPKPPSAGGRGGGDAIKAESHTGGRLPPTASATRGLARPGRSSPPAGCRWAWCRERRWRTTP